MRKTVFSIFLGLLLSPPAAAQDIVDAYFAMIGPNDRFNSSGVALGSLGAVLQQDRANLHRFGRGDPADEFDPYFGNPDLRARIPALYEAGPRDPLIEQIVRDGPGLSILVLLCGRGGVVNYLVVDFADGDGHRGC